MSSKSEFPPSRIDFRHDSPSPNAEKTDPSNSLARIHLRYDGRSLPVSDLSIHGFNIAQTVESLGDGEVSVGDLLLEGGSLPVRFRARDQGIGTSRCTLVDLNLDEQDTIENATQTATVSDEPSEFEDLSYDELARGGKTKGTTKKGKRSSSKPSTERRGAVAAILCAVGLTVAIIVISTIVLGKSSLEVHNGALVGNYLPISSVEDGTVAQLFVQSGDRVEQGAPLFRIHNREQVATMEELQTTLSRAVDEFDAQDRQLQAYAGRLKISMRAVEKDIDIARAELTQAEVDHGHAEGLVKNLAPLLRSTAISKIEYQTAVARRDSLAQQLLVRQATIDRLQVSLDAISTSRITIGSGGQLDDRANQLKMQRDLAEAQVKEARRKIEFHNLQLANQTVHAAEAGTVYTTYRGAGEFVRSGDPVLSLSLAETNWAVGHISPDDALRVRPGQKVHVKIPSIDLETEGTIASVGHRGVYSSGSGWSNDFRSDPINIPIKISLPEETQDLPSGLRLKMSVALERRWPWQKNEIDFTPTVPEPQTEEVTTEVAGGS